MALLKGVGRIAYLGGDQKGRFVSPVTQRRWHPMRTEVSTKCRP